MQTCVYVSVLMEEASVQHLLINHVLVQGVNLSYWMLGLHLVHKNHQILSVNEKRVLSTFNV